MWTTTDASDPSRAYRRPMTDERPPGPHDRPILLCAGTEPAAAAGLAEAAAALLAERRAVVLATWSAPPVPSAVDAAMDALYDIHADLRRAARGAAEQAAAAACEALDAHGVEATTRVYPDDGSPWRSILERADELDAAVIVAGIAERPSPHPGSLGRQARALAHRSHRPLLLLPADAAPARTDAPAVLAYDGSGPADGALRAAQDLLRPRPASLATAWQSASYVHGLALLAVPPAVALKGADELDDETRRRAQAVATNGAQQLGAAGWQCETAVPEARNVAHAIIGAADARDAAIVVTGTRGRSRVAAALLGSTAEGILRHASRPVLLVPPAADGSPARPPPDR
jgi:nucleotide-binding universal stress UspA family protein